MYSFFSALSGVAWGLLGLLLIRPLEPGLIMTLAMTPWIGLLFGKFARRFNRRCLRDRLLISIAALYLGLAIFGLIWGLGDFAVRYVPFLRGQEPVPDDRLLVGVTQRILEMVAGATIGGFIVVLWPLSFLNHFLMDRYRESRQRPVISGS